MIDVGQGDGLLLRSPSGRAIVVDAGGSRDRRFDPGERRVAPVLWRAGVRRIDALVVSHAHPDHAGGVPFLLRAFRVESAWEGPAAPRTPRGSGWTRPSARPACAASRVARGARLDWDGASLAVLGPAPPPGPLPRVRNEDSLVIDVRFGEVHLLLTGDVDRGGGARACGSAAGAGPEGPASRQPDEQQRRSWSTPCARGSPSSRPAPAIPSDTRTRRSSSGTGAPGPWSCGPAGTGACTSRPTARRVWVRASGEGQERRIR